MDVLEAGAGPRASPGRESGSPAAPPRAPGAGRRVARARPGFKFRYAAAVRLPSAPPRPTERGGPGGLSLRADNAPAWHWAEKSLGTGCVPPAQPHFLPLYTLPLPSQAACPSRQVHPRSPARTSCLLSLCSAHESPLENTPEGGALGLEKVFLSQKARLPRTWF